MRDVNSSDIIPIWRDIRTSSDMNELYDIRLGHINTQEKSRSSASHE